MMIASTRACTQPAMTTVPARAWLVRTLCAVAAMLVMASAQAVPLRGYWRPVQPGDRVEAIRALPQASAGERFDPALLHAIPGGRHGAWVLLWPQFSLPAPADAWVLQVIEPGLQAVSLFPERQPPILGATLFKPGEHWRGHGRLGFLLPSAEVTAAPIVLRIEPGRAIAPPLRFALDDEWRFARNDAQWLAIATASLAVMLAMAVMAVVFAIELRDLAFLWYAAYVLAYAMILAVQSGYVAQPLEWGWVSAAPSAWGRAATALSVLFATLFVSRFADLRRYAPRMRIAVLTIGIAVAVLMGLGSLPVPALSALAARVINPLLILGGPTILLASLLAWWRGSRYGGFFLLGWGPLLAITVLGSMQVFGLLTAWTWLGDASFVAGAIEALVLSLGLADRALALRHDRDLAQAQADTDGLTHVYNRRGLDDRIGQRVAIAHRRREPLALLFLDLDRFKLLNDRQGHAAGDAALVALARLMRADMRTQDVLGRYGGEEFVAVLPGCDSAAARAIAERICVDLRNLRIAVSAADDMLTASIGVATLARNEDAAALVARADAAMYAGKRQGGDQVVVDAGTEPGAVPIA